MRARHVVVVAVAAAVTVASVAAAAAGPSTKGKLRVQLTTKILPSGTGELIPLRLGGAIELDRGTFGGDWASHMRPRQVTVDGQSRNIYAATWTFTGKKGTLVFRERNEWAEIGNDANGDGQPDGIAFGTWKVVRGTGQYAGATGGGRSAHSGLGRKWYARFEGFLILP